MMRVDLAGDGHLDVRLGRCCTGAVRLDVATQATPEQVRRTLIDFSDRRLSTWDRTLDPRTYELRELGDTWAPLDRYARSEQA